MAVPASAPAHRELLGRSVQGRPIVAYEVGDPAGIPVLVVGCIHGNESAGIAVARYLLHNPPAGSLWIVPVLNSDGGAHKTRGNANGVDLNATFPIAGADWAASTTPAGVRSRKLRRGSALADPAHASFRIRVVPQHLDLVWASGGNLRVERRFAEVSGLPYHRLPPLAGSAIDWQNHALPGTTAFGQSFRRRGRTGGRGALCARGARRRDGQAKMGLSHAQESAVSRTVSGTSVEIGAEGRRLLRSRVSPGRRAAARPIAVTSAA